MGHFVAAFVAPKLDILNNNPGEFPAEFVATKADILEETSGEVAAAFVVTKAGILSKTWSFSNPIAKCFLCLDLSRSSVQQCHSRGFNTSNVMLERNPWFAKKYIENIYSGPGSGLLGWLCGIAGRNRQQHKHDILLPKKMQLCRTYSLDLSWNMKLEKWCVYQSASIFFTPKTM